ncbi:TRAP transporter substrate-binding protein [Halomonas sp. KAO]|uniref:TRAP transporter substrate-binding protein n=1 Tax=unclassified Halomonas TaxID=2609666 RepID=UPI0018A061DE|nr:MULTISPECIES: TRAP transporter substrate-binding protein [unclassified Halomonas]MBF7054783.1 TRAP transporter substrate-binding protein [Halomonas sp. KAO]MDT0502747.1 TRAP transporter substrate-binding protein [Halomonas sp. PAR7]MDT0513663.1 TRAP transporter substrate-binding protein [Halomonas sp. LES1]MDT0593193.1 TRAP transporter substrate-binding protein [Halomonas sp. PAR8]
MNKTTGLLLGTLTAAVMSSAALAETTLTISTWAGPNHGINSMVWPTWGAWIEEATEGRVKVDVVHDMGPPDSQMEIVADGIADATWVFHGYNAGRFELTKLPEFPTFEDFSSENASAAYWRTHQEYLAEAEEHRGVDVVAAGVHGPGWIFTSDKVETLDELEGKRIRVGGGVMGDLSEALELTGVALPPTGVYEAGSQGVIDGAMLVPEGLRSFRVAEIFPHTLKVDGGFYRGSFTIAMNPMFWDRVSPEDREAIESVSGERLSRLFGYMMDEMDVRGVKFAEEQGHTFTDLGEEDLEKLRNISDEMIAEWADKVTENRGVDAMAAIEFFREQLAVAAEEETVAPQVPDEYK